MTRSDLIDLQVIYQTATDYLNAPRKKLALFGMSGLGKTRISTLLREKRAAS